MPKSNNTTIWTTIYLVVCGYGCKIGLQKDMCSKEIGVCAQNMQTMGGLMVNMGPIQPLDKHQTTKINMAMIRYLYELHDM